MITCADLEDWEVTNERCALLLRDVPWGAMSFHPSLHRIMASRRNGPVTVWDLETGEEVTRFQLAAEPFRLEFALGGERFAWVHSVGTGGMLSVNNTTNGALQVSRLFADDLGAVRWHPSGRWISAPDEGGAIHLIDSRTGEVRTLGRHKAQAVVVEFSPDGGYLISGGWDRELICWDLRKMQRTFTMGAARGEAAEEKAFRESEMLGPGKKQFFGLLFQISDLRRREGHGKPPYAERALCGYSIIPPNFRK
jgi:WD40 repeat protein